MKPKARRVVQDLHPYVPGRPAEDDDHGLASNESSVGPSERVRAAVARAIDRIHRYPDPLATQLRERLAEELRVGAEQILVSNGSDELIYLLCLAYQERGARVVMADPPYRLHEVVSHVFDGDLHKIPLRDWRHDLTAMAQARAEIAFICNPHNPTGTAVDATAIEAFVKASPSTLTVVDEAYIDFVADVTSRTILPLAREGRVVMLRTFSKIMGMAGLRLGYLVGSSEVVDMLRRIRPPFSVNSLAQAAGVAELEDVEQRNRRRSEVLAIRPKLIRMLQDAGYSTVPSEANFVLALTPNESEFVDRLATQGLSVRPGTSLGFPGSARITVPSERGLRLLENALRMVPVSARSPQ